MRRTLYIYFILFLSFAEASSLYLKDQLQLAKNGNYIISKQEKNLTMFHILNNDQTHLLIEEITIPEKSIDKEHNWRQWLFNKAPGHTCWIKYQLESKTGKMTHYYLLNGEQWIEVPAQNHLFSQLLNLSFRPLPEHLRRRRGSISAHNSNPYWQPKMVYEGRIIENETLFPWQTSWPNDGSELSGKTLIIYIPNQKSLYPNYFPYWIEVKGKVTRAHLYLIDSGHITPFIKNNL